MTTLLEIGDRRLDAVSIAAPDDLVVPFEGVTFPCLVWDHDGSFDGERRAAVARALLDAGCRYAVCGGMQCQAWESSFDTEFIMGFEDSPDGWSDDEHVMTTSHADETIDDVAFFFVCCTHFGPHSLTRYLIVHIGASPAVVVVEGTVRDHAVGAFSIRE